MGIHDFCLVLFVFCFVECFAKCFPLPFALGFDHFGALRNWNQNMSYSQADV